MYVKPHCDVLPQSNSDIYFSQLFANISVHLPQTRFFPTTRIDNEQMLLARSFLALLVGHIEDEMSFGRVHVAANGDELEDLFRTGSQKRFFTRLSHVPAGRHHSYVRIAVTADVLWQHLGIVDVSNEKLYRLKIDASEIKTS